MRERWWPSSAERKFVFATKHHIAPSTALNWSNASPRGPDWISGPASACGASARIGTDLMLEPTAITVGSLPGLRFGRMMRWGGQRRGACLRGTHYARLSSGKPGPPLQRLGVQRNSIRLAHGLARRNRAPTIMVRSPDGMGGRMKSENIVTVRLVASCAGVNSGLVLAKLSHLG